MQNKFFYLLLLLTAGILVSSCNKNFDAPPEYVEPDIRANITIKDLKTRHAMGGLEQITENLIIEGIVVGDDKSGNLYKSIAIQDATGGITVRMDATNLYTSYPVGRKVFISLRGLYLGDYNRLVQIGGGIDDSNGQNELAPIASSLFDTYIVRGSAGNTVTPKVVTIDKLHDSLQSMLIQLDNMEFIEADTSKTYADAVGKVARSLNVKACAGAPLIVRTSGFATFAGVNVPNGKGTLLAIYTVFGNTKQLVIRDQSDVQFTGDRCGTGPTTEIDIADIRELFENTPVAAPDGRRIRGVVISDRNAKNINERNLIIQQDNEKAGIMVRFADAHTFDAGDILEVNVSGQSIEEFNGTLQINNVPNSFATKVGTGTIAPRVATIADIIANFEAWESTLVKVEEEVTITGSSAVWSGAHTFTAGTNVIKTFINSAATFATTAFPATAASITGYLNQGGATKDLQLLIRSTEDVEGATTPPPPPPPATEDLIISEYVEGTSSNKYIEIYNASATAADLSRYKLKLYPNAATTITNVGNEQALDALPSGPTTLAAGATLVLRNGSAALVLPAGVTAYASTAINFNGDDVVELEKDGVVIDVFGTRGVRPAAPASWNIAGDANAAIDKSVRRKAGIKKGNANWTASAGTNVTDSEWEIVTVVNDVSNLGTR